MKITSISYKSNLPSLWDKILPWLLSPLIILLVIIFPFIFIYNFIRRKIFKIKDEELVKCVLFENEDFKVVKKGIRDLDDNRTDFIYDFFYGMDIYDEDFLIYQIIDKKSLSDLGGFYISPFHIMTEHHLYLQKIAQEEDEVKTYLISLEKKTGKVEVVKEIGQYVLEHYNEKTKTITGYGKDDYIKIELE